MNTYHDIKTVLNARISVLNLQIQTHIAIVPNRFFYIYPSDIKDGA